MATNDGNNWKIHLEDIFTSVYVVIRQVDAGLAARPKPKLWKQASIKHRTQEGKCRGNAKDNRLQFIPQGDEE